MSATREVTSQSTVLAIYPDHERAEATEIVSQITD
jgi:hypothetical protein